MADKAYWNNIIIKTTPSDANHAAKYGQLTAHTGATSIHVPASTTAGRLLVSANGAAPTWLSISTSVASTSTDAQVPSAKSVYTYVNSAITALNLATTYAAASHNHAASEITSGTIASARLTSGTTSAKGIVQLTSSASAMTNETFAMTPKGVATYATATFAALSHTHDLANITDVGTAATLTISTSVASTSTDAQAPTALAVYTFVNTNYAAKSHTHSMAQVTGLGTAATKNIGTSSGTIPVLDANGKLVKSVIPAVAISNTFTAASQAEMLALSSAEEGDVVIRTDLNKTFILTSSASSAYSALANWQELLTPSDAVSSVNGQTGAVTLTAANVSAIATSALITSVVSTSTDTQVPTALAVYTFVNTNYAAKSHNHAASAITSGTLAAARLPLATTAAVGGVKIGGGLSVASGVVSVDLNTLNIMADYTDATRAVTAPAIMDWALGQFKSISWQPGSVVATDDALFYAPVFDPDDNSYLVPQDSIAPIFSASNTYAVGDYCMYQGCLYKCSTAVTAAGTWTGATNWRATTAFSEMLTGSRYETTITGNTVATSFTITHNLGVRNVFCEVIDSTGHTIDVDIQRTSANALNVVFGVAPSASDGVFAVIIRK